MSQICMNETASQVTSTPRRQRTRFVLFADAVLESIVDGLLTWQRRHKDRMHLLSLDDRLLRDIGVSLADVEGEASKPFWRP